MYQHILNRLIPYIRTHRYKVIGAILLSVLLAGISATQVSLIKPIFDQAFVKDSSPEEIYKLSLFLLALGILNFPCRFLHFYWLRFIVDKATCQVRDEIFAKVLRLPSAFYSKNKQGELVSILLNDAHIFSQGFKSTIDLIREPLKAISYLTMAFLADWQLTLVFFLVAPFLVGIFGISGKKVKKNQSVVQEDQGELTHRISEGLGAHKVTKAFNLENFVLNRFRFSQNNFFNSQMRTTFVEELAHPLVELVGAMAFSGLIIFSYYRVQQEALTVGGFVQFIGALAMFMDPIRKFSQANIKLSQSQAAGDRIFSLLNGEEEIFDVGERKPTFKDEIVIDNVSFSYDEKEVLSNLSMKIKRGQKIALVGLSGSGKSTLINLLLGLYPVEKGKITIDGTSIQDVELRSLRDLFGLVSQDIFLFHDSIKDNLSLGGEFSESELEQSVRVAYAKDFISQLSEGMDTVVGDRGMRLSGGQRQRITIARAFLQNPDILLFDEATSALDNESEQVVQKALEKIAGEKTVVAVAHRLSTIQDYDQIYVLNEGCLVEQGTHDELINKDGEYAKLYQLSQKS